MVTQALLEHKYVCTTKHSVSNSTENKRIFRQLAPMQEAVKTSKES